ncbi:putative oxidoreductase [Paraburkholderia phenazinium]|jgi:putative oxidoreductase|uniref:Putative oxidoreductase n=1 Tax=Paraburkholderia phenazinium TaxID=60549 RepID=A0A1G7RTT6_9BURK|nr:putative oxidoreductase [Paraburkholderia phenazinium]
MSDPQNMKLSFPAVLVSAIGTAKRLIQTLAQPRLAQLVLRPALAVSFWKSGILKWHGFLLLNDTAIDPFTQEFQLHLPD